MSENVRLIPGAMLAACLLLAGCGRNAQEHLAAGTEYEKGGKLREAVLEYRNALDKDPNLAVARARLGEVLLKTGDAAGGMRELVRAADGRPDDVDLQVRTGRLLLQARQFDAARGRADKALAKAPRRADAIVLRANALAGLSHFDEAIEQLQEALRADPQAALHTNLGAVQLLSGNLSEAEASFLRAVQADATSIDARLALANFYWSAGRLADAERALDAARQIDPKHVPTQRALALLYVTSKRAPQAEPLLGQIAATTGAARDRLDLADYYVVLGRTDDAVRELATIGKDQRLWSAARSRAAMIEQTKGRHDAAVAAISEVLVREPRNVDALVTKARILLAAGKAEDAEPLLRSAVDMDPRHVGARYLLGTVHASRQRFDDAAAAFNEVIRLNPRAVMAQVHLARLDLLRGQAASSVERSQQVLRATPDSPTAVLLLVRGYLAQGQLDAADKALAPLVEKYPSVPEVLVLLGRIRLGQTRTAAARAAFDKAAAADQTLDALTGQVTVDIAEGKVDAAEARLASRLAAQPRNSRLLLLSAQVALARRDGSEAESRLRKAIDADADNFDAYRLLARIYLARGKLDEARQELESLAARQPKPVATQTLIAILLQTQGQTAAARERYEKVLQLDRHAAVAANNLAWMYAESGERLNEALDLAQRAKAAMPRSAEVNDTLGFVYLKRDVPSLAVPPLREAVKADPTNPTYRFRLGQALARTGQADGARTELEKALELKPDFSDAPEARRLLKTLG